jgi:hypothetical protein
VLVVALAAAAAAAEAAEGKRLASMRYWVPAVAAESHLPLGMLLLVVVPGAAAADLA